MICLRMTYYFSGLPDSSSKPAISHARITCRGNAGPLKVSSLRTAAVICRDNLDVIIRKRDAVIINPDQNPQLGAV